MGFQPSTYVTNEGSSVSVCITILDGSSAVPITLSVGISEGTADGNSNHSTQVTDDVPSLSFSASDYNHTQSAALVLGAGISSTCIDIVIINDEVYEENESFLATVSTTNDNVVVTISSAVVLIIDDDGTSFCG